jgi:hypothetical protein
MNPRWYRIAFALFVLCLSYDLVTWGAVRALPDVGDGVAAAAGREDVLASTYIFLGQPLDRLVPPLGSAGKTELLAAFADGMMELREQPVASMDLVFGHVWNDVHLRLRLMYWATPVLLVLGLWFWWRRARPIRLMRGESR